MKADLADLDPVVETVDPSDQADAVEFQFGFSRRGFVQMIGAGLAIAVTPVSVDAQNRRGRRNEGATSVAARIQIAPDGKVTILTGKVEGGQGARAEITQAAAEELRLRPEQIEVVMGDTRRVPDDGLTAGSRTTSSTVPAVRLGAAAARKLLLEGTARKWNVDVSSLDLRDGVVRHSNAERKITLAELAQDPEILRTFQQATPADLPLTPTGDWKVLGSSVPRPNGRDLVTGAHLYPSDMTRPGMLYGKVLRPPSYGAKLVELDPAAVQSLKDVTLVRDGDFVGVAAPSSFVAEKALELLKDHARWETSPHPSSTEVYAYLREKAQEPPPDNPFAEALSAARHRLRATYHTAYIQHAPMETRTALAEWKDDTLTVWAGTQNPFGHAGELARAFRIPQEKVQVIVPDFGGAFGGKHSGEAAVEAARLARGAKKPVLLRWTRAEEFTWAYFRPAAVIDAEASLDGGGKLTSWYFININSGGSAVDTPYAVPNSRSRYIGSNAPLRHGSYRALASVANTFARESFMDELAATAGIDPLRFRLQHLENPRLRAVLEEVARRFGWEKKRAGKDAGMGVGLACGTEKGSHIATCAEVEVDASQGKITPRHIVAVFECGAIMNPDNLLTQVRSGLVMALGPVLREEMRFEEGTMRNASFGRYLVPRFHDLPQFDIHLLNRPDLPSVGGGETPLIAVAPAIANAVFHATGRRLRQMPLRFEAA